MVSDANFYRRLLDTLSEGVSFLDKERRITFWNKGAERISGYSSDDVVGSLCSEKGLNHHNGNGCTADECPAYKTIVTGRTVEQETYLSHKEGQRVPVVVRTSPLRDETGDIVGCSEVFRETFSGTDYECRVRQLETLALVDPLTGAGNRRFGEMQLRATLNKWSRYGWPFALLFIDIDHFKEINDRFGHDVGDSVLRMVGQTLIANVRPFDHVIRWGGEEFLVLLMNVGGAEPETIAEKLRAVVAKSHVATADRDVAVTVSIGAVRCNGADTTDALLKRADQLMYASKEAGRNRVTAA